MRRWRPALAATAVIAILTGTAAAQPANVAVTNVWARASAGPADTGAIYATISASEPDRLTGASTPVANMAELHRDSMTGGVEEMRAVPDGLSVTPGTPVQLNPGGYHLMLTGLKRPLHKGEQFPITFTFEHAGQVLTEVTVAGPGATEADAHPVPGAK